MLIICLLIKKKTLYTKNMNYKFYGALLRRGIFSKLTSIRPTSKTSRRALAGTNEPQRAIIMQNFDCFASWKKIITKL